MRSALLTLLLLAAVPLLADGPCNTSPMFFFDHTVSGDIQVVVNATVINLNNPSPIVVTIDGSRIELAQTVAPHGDVVMQTGCFTSVANLGALPEGTYDVVWTVKNGDSRTVKFVNAGASSCGETFQITPTVRRSASREYQLDITERTIAATYDQPLLFRTWSGFMLQQTEHINSIAIIEGYGRYHCTQRTFLLGTLPDGGPYTIDVKQFVNAYPDDPKTLSASTTFYAGIEQPRRRGVRH